MEKHKKRAMMAIGFGIGFLLGFELYKEKSEILKLETKAGKILKEADKLEGIIKKKIRGRKNQNRTENYIE